MTGDLVFTVLDVVPESYAAAPLLEAQIGISGPEQRSIRAIALRCQVRIEPLRRDYTDPDAEGLRDLFGPRARWTATQRTFLWQHTTTLVSGFTGTTRASLPLVCTYDLEVAAAKYFHSLHDGFIPLQFLFSGTVFAAGPRGFSVEQVPWDCEATYDLPVAVWRELMAQHFPNSGWVRLPHETITALAAFKSEHGLLTLDDALNALLLRAEAPPLCGNGSAPERR